MDFELESEGAGLARDRVARACVVKQGVPEQQPLLRGEAKGNEEDGLKPSNRMA